MNPGLLLMFGGTLIVMTIAAAVADLIEWLGDRKKEKKQ